MLLRRGHADAATARAFLAGADPGHDPRLLGDMDAACERIRAAIASRQRICVHGDYDADGICATALAVLVLRELGADVSWHLPSRFEEGYGVSGETLDRLAGDGCGLVVTVDCGITAVAEVARAKALGLDVVVTDHHRPGDELPDCPIVATRPSDYPFPELCGTGVVYKLGQALLGPGSEELRRHLDLVAIATISDVVPLVDENRYLARAGLKALARTQKPGLRALMRSAGVDPAAVDAGSVGFRLAPRINAAGRLSHPETALQLLLTEDDTEAAQLAGRLEELNRERQAVEDRILREAVAQVEAWPESRQRRRGYVVAHEDWHEGVIGIVASRLVERFNRPVVLIAGTDGDWKGSGRSIPSFDLHGALGDLLRASRAVRRAPRRSRVVDRPREARGLRGGVRRGRRRGASGGGSAAADRGGRGRFRRGVDARPRHGARTPRAVRPRQPGGDRSSSRRAISPTSPRRRTGSICASACATVTGPPAPRSRSGLGRHADRARREVRHDVLFRLEENRWNGTVAPQLVVRQILETPERHESLREWLAEEFRKDRGARDATAQAIFDELGLEAGGPRRQLLESDGFRALLAEEPPAVAEAA